MIIDESNFKKSSFTLLTKEDYTHSGQKDNIEIILQKHNILKNKDYLSHSSESNYLLLLKYIEKKYYFNKELPEDIVEIIQSDLEFKKYILTHNKKRLTQLFTNDSAIFFKEIITIINFLSNGKKYNIFINYDQYDFDEIARLFRDYEDLLYKENSEDSELFNINFKLYTQLFKTYNQLCAINYLDIERKSTIQQIVNLNMESINNLKHRIQLNKLRLNKINYHLAKELYHFTHLNYVKTTNKSMKDIIKNIFDLLKKQADGYSLAKSTKFGGNIKYESREYASFKIHSSYLLILLLKKIDRSFDNIDFNDLKELEKSVTFYNTNFPNRLEDGEYESLDDLKIRLLNTLVYNYDFKNTSALVKKDHKSVIDDFIITGVKYKVSNLKHIHNILLFTDDLEEDKYLDIAHVLIESSAITNDYYEYYKLKTIDIIINYYIYVKKNVEIKDFIQKVHTYLQKNKNASHLLSIFSKVTLSISHYYSKDLSANSLQTALKEYSLFVSMNGNKILNNQYQEINKQILSSFANNHIKNLKSKKENFNEDDLISLGQDIVDYYMKYSELDLKNVISKELSYLTDKIINHSYNNKNKLQNILSTLISQNIFHGICEVIILGLTQKSSQIIDLGYKYYSLELTKGYSVQFVFPAVYENIFNTILKKNKEFILINFSNLLYNFTHSEEDNTSKHFKNLDKLKEDLALKSDEDISFVEVYATSFSKLNLELGFDLAEKFMLSILEKIKSFLKITDEVYNLNNGRIGIILSGKTSFKILSDKIRNIIIKRNEQTINCNFKIIETTAKKNDLLIRSAEKLRKEIIQKELVSSKKRTII